MSAPVALPEAVQQKLPPGEPYPVLVLEGDTRMQALMLPIMLWALALPVVALVVALPGKAPLGLQLTACGGLLLIPLLPYLALARQPSDVLVTADGIHLFWRLFPGARHRFIAFDTLKSIGLSSTAFTSFKGAVFMLESGARVDLEVFFQTPRGAAPIYRVRHNATSAVFTDGLPSNHDQAFLSALREVAPAKVVVALSSRERSRAARR